MTGEVTADPHTAWHREDAPADELLRRHVSAVLGHGEVRVGRLCPSCGSDRHGRPWAWHAAHPHEVHVSLARTEGYVVTVVSLRGAVGVDVESVAAVARDWAPELVLAPGESARTPQERAWCWAAKEAVLKRRGTGLATPMTQVRLAEEAGLRDLPAPEGLVAVLAGPP